MDKSPREAKARRSAEESAGDLPAGHPSLPGHIQEAIDALDDKEVTSGKEDLELICSTVNPEDCYPKIFQATDEFQIVREGQELPHGLHVRLDVTTGEKQAKLNDPNEVDSGLEGLPVDSSIVVVESEGGGEETPELRVPSGAPAYEPVGKVKVPETESQAFYDSLTVLKTLSLNDRPIDAALDILMDISHDIYYGLKITEDPNAVKELLCMMSSQDVFPRDHDDEVVKQAGHAASIIGAALQNNHKALDEVEKYWGDISKSTCTGTDRKLSEAVFNSLLPQTPASKDASKAEGNQLSLTKAKASALRGLIKSPTIRDDFLANEGMAQILAILALERPDLLQAQQKLANLVLDNFLDEGMGATLGVWPRPGETDHDWDYQLKSLAKLHRAEKDHWSGELWKRLQETRQTMRVQGGAAKTEL